MISHIGDERTENKLGSPLLYFMHIEKSAGTSIRHNLEVNYPAKAFLNADPFSRVGADGKPKTLDGNDQDVHEFVSSAQDREFDLRCIAAHLPFGIDRYLTRPVRYVAFVREPVSRCISSWYFAYQKRHAAPLWSVLESYNFDLRCILRDGVVPQFSNDQVRMITGVRTCEITQDTLKLACDLVEQRFFFVGVIERFRDSLEFLASQLEWQKTSHSRLNVGKKTDKSLIPAGAEKYFRDANEWDWLFYEWLLQKYLPARLDSQSPGQVLP